MLNTRFHHPTDESFIAKENEDNDDESKENVRKGRKFVVFEYCLLQLLNRCGSYGQEVELNTSTMGTLLMVTGPGTCPDGHVLKWQSQPLIRDISAGNLLVAAAAAILFCGLTFTGICNLAKLLNLAMFSESTFYRLQREYLFPVVHTNYLKQQDAVVEFVRDSNLKLSGDQSSETGSSAV